VRIRGLRGAIVVPEDTREAVLGATTRLVTEMMERNELEAASLVSVIFTTTPDLRSAFPAEAARRLGMTDVPLLCAAEIDVAGAMARVVRVLMHAETDRSDISHVYLDGAESLRDDL
jgi:chorismate mutase